MKVQALVGLSLIHTATAGICNAAVPGSWTNAASANPQLKGALDELSKYAVATWYTDRWGDNIDELLRKCDGQTPSIVIYGLPNKDCAHGFSAGGSNKNSEMYKAWIQSLVKRVGNREVIYVLEPDAIGLLSNNQCAVQNGYLENMKAALSIISAGNPNAKVYADVASWSQQGKAADALNDLKKAGRLNGITINTSNYKTKDQLIGVCESLSAATQGLHCVFDTSRNYRGSKGDEWCNSRTAGIGAPPGEPTGHNLVDYNLWLKVPGESDGECTGQSSDAMIGPSAGAFFVDGFTSLWNNGWFVDQRGLPKIGGSWPAPSSAPTPKPYTPSPATDAPKPSTSKATEPPSTAAPTTETPKTTPRPTTTEPETEAPTTVTPEPTTTEVPTVTPEPTTETPEPTTETPEPTYATRGPSDNSGTSETESAISATNPDVSTTSAPTQSINDVSVKSSKDEETTMSAGMISLIACVGMAAVVATVLAVMVIRKRNMREKRDDFVERDSRGIVVLGVTHGLETERCMQVL